MAGCSDNDRKNEVTADRTAWYWQWIEKDIGTGATFHSEFPLAAGELRRSESLLIVPCWLASWSKTDMRSTSQKDRFTWAPNKSLAELPDRPDSAILLNQKMAQLTC